MSYAEKILHELCRTTLSYNGLTVNIFGVPKIWDKKKSGFYTALHRLKEQDCIKETSEGYVITTKGRKYVEKKLQRFKTFEPSAKSKARNLLVLFDIVETKKAEREWFRWHLKKFGYEMVQKSVWLGPSPLPKEFVAYTKQIGLEKSIKTFKIASNPR